MSEQWLDIFKALCKYLGSMGYLSVDSVRSLSKILWKTLSPSSPCIKKMIGYLQIYFCYPSAISTKNKWLQPSPSRRSDPFGFHFVMCQLRPSLEVWEANHRFLPMSSLIAKPESFFDHWTRLISVSLSVWQSLL